MTNSAAPQGEFAVTLRGDVRFNEAEDDIGALSGSLHLLQVVKGRRYLLEYLSDNENVMRSFFIDGRRREFDAAARAWLAQAIPLFLRESGWMAHERAQRILINRGPAALADEAARIQAGIPRSLYLLELVNAGRMEPAVLGQAVTLTASIDRSLARRDVAIALFRRQQLDAGHVLTLVNAVASMQGDFEKRAVLIEAVPRLGDDPALLSAFMSALSGMVIEGEVRHVLNEFDRIEPLSATSLAAILTATQRIKAPFERRQILELFAARTARLPELVPSYLQAASGLRPPFERRAALVALIRTGRLASEHLHAVLDATAGMTADANLREVLLAMAVQMPAERELLQRYRRIAATLDDADRRAALQAIARHEAAG